MGLELDTDMSLSPSDGNIVLAELLTRSQIKINTSALSTWEVYLGVRQRAARRGQHARLAPCPPGRGRR